MRKTRILAAASLLAAWAAASGCAGERSPLESFRPPSGVSAKSSPALAGHPIKRIAVLPFRNESGVPQAGRTMAGIFYEKLASSRSYEVQPPPAASEEDDLKLEFRLRGGRGEGVRNEQQDAAWLKEKVSRFISTVQPYLTNLEMIYPGEYFEGRPKPKKKTLKGTVAKGTPSAADEPDFDAVLTGVVTVYRNRSGGPFLGDKGARVSYAVYLLSAKDGQVLWEASFNEEQIFLLDNLLLLPRYAKEGFTWQTNDTLARNGMGRVLATFPGWNRLPAEDARPPRTQ